MTCLIFHSRRLLITTNCYRILLITCSSNVHINNKIYLMRNKRLSSSSSSSSSRCEVDVPSSLTPPSHRHRRRHLHRHLHRRRFSNRRKRSIAGGKWRVDGTNAIFARRLAVEMWLVTCFTPHLGRASHPGAAGDAVDVSPATCTPRNYL